MPMLLPTMSPTDDSQWYGVGDEGPQRVLGELHSGAHECEERYDDAGRPGLDLVLPAVDGIVEFVLGAPGEQSEDHTGDR